MNAILVRCNNRIYENRYDKGNNNYFRKEKTMKKTLLALATMSVFTGVAHAEDVTLYGVIDEAYRFSTHANSSGNSLNQITDGMQQGSRLGFKGSEDLGGGLKAIFQLEAGFSTSNGQSLQGNRLFGRNATVGLSDNQWGTLTVGRQNNLGYDFAINTDVYGVANNVAIAGYQSYLTGFRWDNSLKYTNKFSGVNVGAQYSSGNHAGDASQGSAYALAAGYTTGPFSVQSVFQRTNDTKDAIPGSLPGQDQSLAGIGATYDFGGPKVFGQYVYNKFNQSNQRNDIFTLGGSYPLTPRVTLKAAYTYDNQRNYNAGHRNTASALASYAFSKRTDVYTEVDYNKFSGGYSNAAYVWNANDVPNSSVGFSLGLRHTF